MTSGYFPTFFRFVVFAVICCFPHTIATAEPVGTDKWKPLFNGQNLDGWEIVIGDSKSDDPNHLVQVHDGAIHMYKDAPPNSSQPAGYVVTLKPFSDYRLRLEYKWGTKKFAPRVNSRRDAGLLYQVVGKDGVWPQCVECQIQENDTGDVFLIHTRATALVDPKTTNEVISVVTNNLGAVQTNRTLDPVFLELGNGGVPFPRGVAQGPQDYARVVRNPMNERDGWNQVEIIVRGGEATYIVNGKTNNHIMGIEQMINDKWQPVKEGKIALQLEYAEVYYRNIEIQQLKESDVRSDP